MRKTRKCTATLLQTMVWGLQMRTCDLSRDHAGDRHHDTHGAWSL